MKHRRRYLLSLLSVLCLAATPLVPAGLSRGDNGGLSYPFSCSWASLTADFGSRDALPQTEDPPAQWYRTDADGHYVNRGWGPRAKALPPPSVLQDARCDSATWKRERILAVALRYIYAPGNPLGLQYRHHHIPQNLVGVQVRNRVGWYRDAVIGAWRPIG